MSRLFVDVRPLRASRNFRFLFFEQVVSLLASNLTVVAVPSQVYRQTHSSLWVGMASLIQLPFLIAGSLWGGAMALFALVHVIWIGLACLAVAGATDVISTVLRNAILQNAITDEFRSRISSIQMAVVTGGPRLGDVESGVVASLVSTEFSIVSGGVVCILGALALIWRRRGFWREETA